MSFDIEKIRQDFPILHDKVYNKPYVYLDNGATTQKPRVVAETLSEYYLHANSNIHRGIHYFSEKCTADHEAARQTIASFLNAKHSYEVIFTSGATASLNLVAYSFGETFVSEGDEIIISSLEHHSNIVPWQMLCQRKKAILKVIPIDANGDLLMDEYEKMLSDRTKIVSVTHISNVMGAVNPVKDIIEKAHQRNIPVVLDGAQAVQHAQVDVQDLDCDFYVFSGHKIYGPTGTGALYGKEEWLNKMQPWQGGGEMVDTVSFDHTTYNELPYKFEAGTPNYIGAIGLAKAIEYIQNIGLAEICAHEANVLNYAEQKLSEIEGLTKIGTPKHRAGAISFLLNDIHPQDVGMILDKLGIAVRTGTHCAQPLMQIFGITGTVRASFAMYNTTDDVDALCAGLERVKRMC